LVPSRMEGFMRAVVIVSLAVALLSGFAVSTANAQGRACHRLWVERNQIYKDYGYCFKTREAIRYFGNRGCRYESEEDVPMPRRDRARISRIQAEERDLGCR
jgi:YARHG domain